MAIFDNLFKKKINPIVNTKNSSMVGYFGVGTEEAKSYNYT
jgi:hypothetical protein